MAARGPGSRRHPWDWMAAAGGRPRQQSGKDEMETMAGKGGKEGGPTRHPRCPAGPASWVAAALHPGEGAAAGPHTSVWQGSSLVELQSHFRQVLDVDYLQDAPRLVVKSRPQEGAGRKEEQGDVALVEAEAVLRPRPPNVDPPAEPRAPAEEAEEAKAEKAETAAAATTAVAGVCSRQEETGLPIYHPGYHTHTHTHTPPNKQKEKA